MNFMESSSTMSRKSFSLKDGIIQRKSGTRYCSRWSRSHVPSIKYVFALLALAMISTARGSADMPDQEELSKWEGIERFATTGRQNRKRASWGTFFLQSKTFWFAIFTILSMIAVSYLGNGGDAPDGVVRASSVFKNFSLGIGGFTLVAIVVGAFIRGNEFYKWKNNPKAFDEDSTIKAWNKYKQEKPSNWCAEQVNKLNTPLVRMICLFLAGFLLLLAAATTTGAVDVDGEVSRALKPMTLVPAVLLMVSAIAGGVMSYKQQGKPEAERQTILGWAKSALNTNKSTAHVFYIVFCISAIIFACSFGFGEKLHIFNDDGGASLFARLMIIIPSTLFMISRICMMWSLRTQGPDAEFGQSQTYEIFKLATYGAILIVGLITLLCANSIGGVGGASLSMLVSIVCVFLGGYGVANHFGNLVELREAQSEDANGEPSDVTTEDDFKTHQPHDVESLVPTDHVSRPEDSPVLPVRSANDPDASDKMKRTSSVNRRRLIALERMVPVDVSL